MAHSYFSFSNVLVNYPSMIASSLPKNTPYYSCIIKMLFHIFAKNFFVAWDQNWEECIPNKMKQYKSIFDQISKNRKFLECDPNIRILIKNSFQHKMSLWCIVCEFERFGGMTNCDHKNSL